MPVGNLVRVLSIKITLLFPIPSLEFGFIVVTSLGLVGVPCSRFWLLSFGFIPVFEYLHLSSFGSCIHCCGCLWFGFDFSEGIINDLHLWFEFVMVSSLRFRVAAEVDWFATCDRLQQYSIL